MNKFAEINSNKNPADMVPHSIEAEQQLLGAILTNNEVYDRVSPIIKRTHFYDPVHARIFELCSVRIGSNTVSYTHLTLPTKRIV